MAVKNQESHYGVYSIVIDGGSILLVHKTRGPYSGKLDLPGGRLQFGEDIKEALLREVMEETHVKLLDIQPFENFSMVVTYKKNKKKVTLHHIGMVYYAVSFDRSEYKKDVSLEDVKSAEWIDFDDIDENKLSDMAYLVLKKLLE